MKVQDLEKNIQNDVTDLRRDLNTLKENSATNVAKGFEKMRKETKDTLSEAAETVKKDVGQGIGRYNSKAEEFVDRLPGDFVEKVAKYPWVAITVGVAIGFLVGGLLKPSRRIIGQ